MPISSTERQAAAEGFSPRSEIRQALIEQRNLLLDEEQFELAVLITHAIWWLADA